MTIKNAISALVLGALIVASPSMFAGTTPTAKANPAAVAKTAKSPNATKKPGKGGKRKVRRHRGTKKVAAPASK